MATIGGFLYVITDPVMMPLRARHSAGADRCHGP